jgi:ATPase subunit of ABC transporter with duplicated ATPase domains
MDALLSSGLAGLISGITGAVVAIVGLAMVAILVKTYNYDPISVIEMGRESQKYLLFERDPVSGRLLVEDSNLGNKCASGSGSFLDHMARRLNYSSIEEFARVALETESPASLSGRCAVFTESDITHLYQKGTPRNRIAAGIHQAISRNYRSAIARGKEFRDKIAFIGGNEIAITTMFKLLAGELEPDEGSVKWGVSTTQAYFPKDNADFFNECDLDLMDWMRQFSEDKRESYLRTFLGRMLFSGDDVYKPVKVLSGGEKVRCMLSKMMLSGANILLFDQPTNHLDLESIAALNNGMDDFKGNIIFTTHDHQLIQTVANRIIEFTDEGKIIDRTMTYDEYIEMKRAQEAEV